MAFALERLHLFNSDLIGYTTTMAAFMPQIHVSVVNDKDSLWVCHTKYPLLTNPTTYHDINSELFHTVCMQNILLCFIVHTFYSTPF